METYKLAYLINLTIISFIVAAAVTCGYYFWMKEKFNNKERQEILSRKFVK